MYLQGRHDAITQLLSIVVAALSFMAVAAALVAAVSPPNKRSPAAPPAYTAPKHTYETSDSHVLLVDANEPPPVDPDTNI